MKQHPTGWKEPVNQALARTDLMFGCPPFTQCHWLVWTIWMMATGHVFKCLVPGIILQGLLMGATQLDAEWPDVLSSLLNEDEEIDP